MITLAAIVLNLVRLHGPDGQLVEINPEAVVALREPRDVTGQHFHKDIKCLIFTSDGKYTSVTEMCDKVEQLLHGK